MKVLNGCVFFALSTALSGTTVLAQNLKNATFCTPRAVSVWEQQQLWKSFIDKFFIQGNATGALYTHMTAEYIQHNPFVLSGGQQAVDAFSAPSNPSDSQQKTTLYHISDVSQNVAWVHSRVDGDNSSISAVVDIFRFNGSCIAEHWDVYMDKPANATNPLALF